MLSPGHVMLQVSIAARTPQILVPKVKPGKTSLGAKQGQGSKGNVVYRWDFSGGNFC